MSAFNYFKPEEVQGLNDELVSKLNNARHIANMPFIINSGKRDPETNKKVGGVSNSSHLKGLAADIACASSGERYLIIRGALAAGFCRIGIGQGHVHLDIDPEKDQNIIFIEYGAA